MDSVNFVKDNDVASPRLIVNCGTQHYEANHLKGIETLSQDAHFLVTVDTFDITSLQQGLGQPVLLEFISEDGISNQLSYTLLAIEDQDLIGANTSAAAQLTTQIKRRYQLTIASRLSLLNNNHHSRIFVDTHLKDILSLILTQAGYHQSQIQFSLANPLPLLNQCVQALESNRDFFERLIRQYGLFYFFEARNGQSTIVISDNNLSSPYLARGILSVHHGNGFNRQLAPDELVSTPNFVGFSQCQYETRLSIGNASAISNEYRLSGDDLAGHNFAQPVSNSQHQANLVAKHQSQALHVFDNTITLTGNVPDVFAGCSFSLSDNSGLNASGDYLCISVEHHCQQPSDENSQDGLTKYYCVVKAILRGTPFKLPLTEFPSLPMVFSAKVETISPEPTLTDSGDYQIKYAFENEATEPLESSRPLKKLVHYACTEQPQATGWHFPLTQDSQVLIGCFNNDPSQAYILGFDMNDEQPSVVNCDNAFHNRLLSRSGHELCFDDDPYVPLIILQTLGSEHYLELNATTLATPYVEWLSRLGSIKLHAAKDLLLSSAEQNVECHASIDQRIEAKNDVHLNANTEPQGTLLHMQSGLQTSYTAKHVSIESVNHTSLLTSKSMVSRAGSEVLLKAAQGDLTINVPEGSTLINADSNISIEGTGNGDITLFSQNGMIKLDNSGNVELIGSDVLSLNGQIITFDGEVQYDLESPQSAAEPNAKSPSNTARISNINLAGVRELAEASQTIDLEYLYQDGEPVQEAPYSLLLADGTTIEGNLETSGKTQLTGMPVGQYTVKFGEDSREYKPVEHTTPNPLFGKISPQSAITMIETGDTSLLNEAGSIAASAGDWLWGTLQGDFNENPSTSQIVVGSVISMIPVIDQVMDCRDVCANVMLLSDDDKANDTMGWIALTLTGIGFIPVLGSAVKGVGKVIVKNPKEAISLAAATLRKLGKGDPVAYIKNIDWQGLAKQATELIKEKIIAIRDALDSITDSWVITATLSSEAIASLTKHSKNLSEVLPKIEEGIAKAAEQLKAKTNKALNEYTGEVPHKGRTGDVKPIKTDELIVPKGNELPGAKPKLIPMKKYKPPCFTPGPDLAKNFKGGKQALEKEFYKQLKAQQAGINKMTVGEYLTNRKVLTDLTDKHGHKKAREMITNGGGAQASARKKLENEIFNSVMGSLEKKDIFGFEAEAIAKEKVKDQMSQLAALHDPDLIAGGKDKISKLGNKRVNSSLGSQWSKADRVAGMDKAAQQAMDNMGSNAQMNIELERCK